MPSFDKFFIDGKWVTPVSGGTTPIISPATEEVIGTLADATEDEVTQAIAAGRRALEKPDGWSSWSADDRADALDRFADGMERRSQEIARLVSIQNGMPIAISSTVEAVLPAKWLRYYAELIRKTPTETAQPSSAADGTTIVRHDPIGVVGMIVPWNFPQVLAANKYAPALAAGCSLVIKPSPETVLDSIPFIEAAQEADIPPGVINVVPGGREIGAFLVGSAGVDQISFTGSTVAGRMIGETCGRLLRPVTLELGGKSAAIILDDANLDLAAVGQQLFGATLANQGQTCYLGTRVLAPRIRYEEIVETFIHLAQSLTIGDPLDEATLIGPLTSERQRDRVEGYIAKGKAEGARLVLGGGRPEGHDKGWYVSPTIFADVDNSHTIAREEIFGPVLSIIPFNDDADAVRIANDSEYGLGGSVWTSDRERGLAVARRVVTGTIGINHYFPDVIAPYGGVKSSGLGRELGPGAISDYQQPKSIYA